MALNPRFRDWLDRRVWVVGASTGIGRALATTLARRGARVAVSARSESALTALDQSVEGGVMVLPMDVADVEAWVRCRDTITAAWGGVDLVIFMAGAYTPLRAWQLDWSTAAPMVEINLGGTIKGLAAVVPQLLRQGEGAVALVASVAGYRGLPQALIYGPTKAALINLAEALYLDLHPRGIGVYLINPGFVRTPLTDQNTFPMPALMEPEAAADAVIAGLARGRFEIHFPRRFTGLLKAVARLPYGLYFRLVRKAVDA